MITNPFQGKAYDGVFVPHFTALVTAPGANAINRNKRPC